MKILIVSKADASIASQYEADAPNQAAYGGPWGDWMQFEHVAVPEEMDANCVGAVLENGQIVLQIDQNKLNAVREGKLEQIRKLREPKLANVDRLVNVAVLNSWTSTEKAEIKTYRDALLDMTEPYKADMSLLDDLDLNSLQFPEEPSES
jgi:hypothetical protein